MLHITLLVVLISVGEYRYIADGSEYLPQMF